MDQNQNKNPEKNENKISEIFYYQTLLQKGWNKLSLETFSGSQKNKKNFSSFKQSYFAGYLEGRISPYDIYNFFRNIEENYRLKNLYPLVHEVKKFLKESNDSMTKKIKNLNNLLHAEKSFYYKIYIFYMQIQGMLRGYNKSVEILLNSGKELKFPIKKLKIEDLLLVQVDGEIPELMRFMQYKRYVNSYDIRNRKFFERIFRIQAKDPKTIWKRMMWRSRCSAYIKLLKNEEGGITDLFTGHNAWTEFTETIRTYKR